MLAVRPVRLVEQGDGALVFSFAPGTRWKRDPRDGTDVRLRTEDWTLVDEVREAPLLSIGFTDRSYGVLFRRGADGSLRDIYVNLQSPLAPWEGGFDYTDHFLDVVIAPDRSSFTWKDEDELAEAVERGLLTPAAAGEIRREGERAIEAVIERHPPFDRDWEDWRPDPAWPVPELVPGWELLRSS